MTEERPTIANRTPEQRAVAEEKFGGNMGLIIISPGDQTRRQDERERSQTRKQEEPFEQAD